jgi:hypothetical protein
MPRTKVDATLEALAEQHADDPERVELLHRARRFKASWIELAEALTGSFQFLKSKAPDVLRRDGLSAPIPSYQSVDFLRRAEAEEQAKPDVMDALRKRVIDEGALPGAVSREFKAAVFPIDEATRKQRDAAALRNVARRLHEILGDTHAVSRRLSAEVTAALDKLLAALGKDEDAAA